MPKTIEGALTVSGQKFAIVVSRFNDFITAKLVGGAVDTLVRHGGRDEDITVIHVPGAFEIPADKIFACLGGNPPTKFLSAIGIEVVTFTGQPAAA